MRFPTQPEEQHQTFSIEILSLKLKQYLFSFLEYVCLNPLSTFLKLRCFIPDSSSGGGADILYSQLGHEIDIRTRLIAVVANTSVPWRCYVCSLWVSPSSVDIIKIL